MREPFVEQNNITDEKLNDIFARLIELYERHAQERQLIIKEREEINRLVQMLLGQTKELGQYENGIRKRIQDCIRESANVAMNNIEKSIAEKASKTNEDCINKITQLCAKTETMIEVFHREKKIFSKLFFIIILSVLLSSFLITGLMNLILR